MTQRLLMMAIMGVGLGLLAACVSGKTAPDSYVGKDGKITVIESDREMCEHACNDTYERCMESKAATDNSGFNGPSGFIGATAECRSDLQSCLPACKGR